MRLRTLPDVIAYLGVAPQTALLDATEVQVRRPAAHQPGRKRFVSGKRRANTIKTLLLSDDQGRLLFAGETHPGSVNDLTQARSIGLVQLVDSRRDLEILADARHQGLQRRTDGAARTPVRARTSREPPRSPEEDAFDGLARRLHSSRRIRVEHAAAHLKHWRALSRHPGRHETFDETVRAVAGLLSAQQHRTRPCRPRSPAHHNQPALPARC